MKTFTTLLTAIAFLAGNVRAADEVILTPGSILHPGDRIYAHDNSCKVIFQLNGNFKVQRMIRDPSKPVESGSYANSWSSGIVDLYSHHGPHAVGYDLQLANNGHLKMTAFYDDYPYNSTVWEVNPGMAGGTSAELSLDEACRLNIKVDEQKVWTNIKTYPDFKVDSEFPLGRVLQKGETFLYTHHFENILPFTFPLEMGLHLQMDCNLVQQVGTDSGNRGEVLWSSQTTWFWEGDDGPRYCYLRLEEGGRIILYGWTFDPEHPGDREQIWGMPLDPTMSDYEKSHYTLTLDPVTGPSCDFCDGS